jgi:hypothetical protein
MALVHFPVGHVEDERDYQNECGESDSDNRQDGATLFGCNSRGQIHAG